MITVQFHLDVEPKNQNERTKWKRSPRHREADGSGRGDCVDGEVKQHKVALRTVTGRTAQHSAAHGVRNTVVSAWGGTAQTLRHHAERRTHGTLNVDSNGKNSNLKNTKQFLKQAGRAWEGAQRQAAGWSAPRLFLPRAPPPPPQLPGPTALWRLLAKTNSPKHPAHFKRP